MARNKQIRTENLLVLYLPYRICSQGGMYNVLYILKCIQTIVCAFYGYMFTGIEIHKKNLV